MSTFPLISRKKKERRRWRRHAHKVSADAASDQGGHSRCHRSQIYRTGRIQGPTAGENRPDDSGHGGSEKAGGTKITLVYV